MDLASATRHEPLPRAAIVRQRLRELRASNASASKALGLLSPT